MSGSIAESFAEALLDPALPVPQALRGGVDRFAVYRNNVVVSLIRALETRFPAARRIVGEGAFAALAAVYVRESPPRSPVMAAYGETFADFVDRARGLDAAPYLADVVRLEAARTRAYHAADAEPLDRRAFEALDRERLGDLTVALHPSLGIVRSRYPLVTIWAMSAGEAEPRSIDDWTPEDALVARPDMDVIVRRLPAGGAAFLDALRQGSALGEAAQAASAASPDFDLTQNLIGLLQAGLAVGLGEASRSVP